MKVLSNLICLLFLLERGCYADKIYYNKNRNKIEGMVYYDKQDTGEKLVLNTFEHAQVFSCLGPSSVYLLQLVCSSPIEPVEWVMLAPLNFYSTDSQKPFIWSRQWISRTKVNQLIHEQSTMFLILRCFHGNAWTGNYTFNCERTGKSVQEGGDNVIKISTDASTSAVRIYEGKLQLSEPTSPYIETPVSYQSQRVDDRLTSQSNCNSSIEFLECPWRADYCEVSLPTNSFLWGIETEDFCGIRSDLILQMEQKYAPRSLGYNGTTSGVLMCGVNQLRLVLEHFYNYNQCIPKLELSWININPVRQWTSGDAPSNRSAHAQVNLQDLEKDTRNPMDEIYSESSTTQKIVNVMNQTTKLLDEVLNGSKSITEIKKDVDSGLAVFLNVAMNVKRNETEEPLGPRILDSIESTLMGFGKKILPELSNQVPLIEYNWPNAMLGVQTTSKGSAHDIYFPPNHTKNVTRIRVPKEWIDATQNAVIYVTTVVPPNVFGNILETSGTSGDEGEKVLNSDVISFSFSNPGTDTTFDNRKGHPVRIMFEHKQSAEATCPNGKARDPEFDAKVKSGLRAVVEGSASCVYLNTTNGKWSTEGCRLIFSDAQKSTCECDHLTAFALLMDPFDHSTGYTSGLKILTWVVCPLSILGLIGTLVIFLTVKPTGHRTDIIINLSACLLFGNVCILVLMDRSYLGLGDKLCTISAMTTHYVYLAAFAWMAAEGIQLYRLAIIVFKSTRQYGKAQYACAYGLPAIIVCTTELTAFLRDDQAYGGDCFCWLVKEYTWGFFGPASIMLIGNLIILILSVKVAAELRNNKILQVHRQVTPFLTWVRGILGLTILLGLSWSVGFLMFTTNRTISHIGAYLFTLLNGLQGAFMFLFHVGLNKQVREGMRNKFGNEKKTTGTSPGHVGRTTS